MQEGDNVIGRRCVGTNINTPIESGDMSMDRRHCIINIKRNKQGKLVYTLRDAPSLTGTFLMNEILGDKDRVRIEDGAIVTIGARNVMSCIGNTHCIKANVNTYQLARKIEKIIFPSHYHIKVSVSGCPNDCGKGHFNDFSC